MIDPAIREQWKKAVVHLEGAADSVSWAERQARLQESYDRLQAGEPPLDALWELSRDLRWRGTATFMHQDGHRFLLTARHVLRNENLAERDARDMLPSRPSSDPADPAQAAMARFAEASDAHRRAEMVDRWIFPSIFRVPRLDEALANEDSALHTLMNLDNGNPEMGAVSYSEPQFDLAVISLEMHDDLAFFANDLERNGYEAMQADVVVEEPATEGDEVFTVGFPDSAAAVLSRPVHPAFRLSRSAGVSVPVFTFGHVAWHHEALIFFGADLTVYPGNKPQRLLDRGQLLGSRGGLAVLPIRYGALAHGALRQTGRDLRSQRVLTPTLRITRLPDRLPRPQLPG